MAGMLVLILLAVLLAGWSVTVLEREVRRRACALREELAGVRGELAAFAKENAETAQSLSGLWREAERKTEALQALLSKDDAEAVIAWLEKHLEAAQKTEERMPAAMLEGFDNLMSYTEKTARGERS